MNAVSRTAASTTFQPQVFTPKRSDEIDDLLNRQSEVDQAVRTCGAALLRGFAIDDQHAFRNFAHRYSSRGLMNYVGGTSPRGKFAEGVYNSTEYPPEMQLDLHNEMSYLPSYPANIYFYCDTPPLERGETTLADGRCILSKIDPSVVEEFEARGGIRYERNLCDDPTSPYSWQAAFETTHQGMAEQRCRETGTEFKWDRGTLCLAQVMPATIDHPLTGEKVWFNQAEGFHRSVLGPEVLDELTSCGIKPRLDARFADGTDFEIEMLQHIRSVKTACTYPHKWQQADILILDNILCMHGRASFTGRRKIVVAMN